MKWGTSLERISTLFRRRWKETGQNKEVGSGITIMGYQASHPRGILLLIDRYLPYTSIAQIRSEPGTKTYPVSTITANK